MTSLDASGGMDGSSATLLLELTSNNLFLEFF